MFTSFRGEIMHQLWTGNSSSVWHEFVNLFFLKGVACGRSKQVGCSTNFGSAFERRFSNAACIGSFESGAAGGGTCTRSARSHRRVHRSEERRVGKERRQWM